MNNRLLLVSFILLTACKSEPEHVEPVKEDKVELIKDVVGDDLIKDKPKDKVAEKEKIENHEKIVKKYGEQWGFCECVIANDSINKASQKNLSDAQLDKLMTRWDYVEQKCQEFLTNPNTTPEERTAHEKKVKKCLKNQGK
jgi:hypothetical protein